MFTSSFKHSLFPEGANLDFVIKQHWATSQALNRYLLFFNKEEMCLLIKLKLKSPKSSYTTHSRADEDLEGLWSLHIKRYQTDTRAGITEFIYSLWAYSLQAAVFSLSFLVAVFKRVCGEDFIPPQKIQVVRIWRVWIKRGSTPLSSLQL